MHTSIGDVKAIPFGVMSKKVFPAYSLYSNPLCFG